MPLVADRVKETSTTTGNSDFTLAGAVTGFKSFASAFTPGDQVYYAIVNGAEWEVGIGTINGVLTRDTVLASSNADALVVFGAGTKDVFSTMPAQAVNSITELGGNNLTFGLIGDGQTLKRVGLTVVGAFILMATIASPVINTAASVGTSNNTRAGSVGQAGTAV